MGILLACCMTCRYGRFCPYGNREDQIFCTRDAHITSKEDLLKQIDRDASFWEREVSALHFCDGFACQSDGFYTYNDFLYYLKKG